MFILKFDLPLYRNCAIQLNLPFCLIIKSFWRVFVVPPIGTIEVWFSVEDAEVLYRCYNKFAQWSRIKSPFRIVGFAKTKQKNF